MVFCPQIFHTANLHIIFRSTKFIFTCRNNARIVYIRFRGSFWDKGCKFFFAFLCNALYVNHLSVKKISLRELPRVPLPRSDIFPPFSIY